jgi:tetratricopeptide (TPR) repeat protein
VTTLPDPQVPDDLPARLADEAAERLLRAADDRRDRELAALMAAHPEHAAALRRLAVELAAAEAMLDVTFAGERRDMPTEIGGPRNVRTLGEGAFGVVRRLVRRNRAAAAMAGSGIVLAVGLAFVFTYGAWKDAEAAEARSRAAANMADVRGIVGRLLQRANDPALFETARGDVMRQALSAEALTFADHLLVSDARDPVLLADRCEALQAISQVHWLLGEPEPARRAAAEAARIAAGLVASEGATPPNRGLFGAALYREGRALAQAARHDEAEPKLAEAAAHLAAAPPARFAALHADALGERAGMLPVEAAAEAEHCYRQAIAIYETLRAGGPVMAEVHQGHVTASLGLGRLLIRVRRYAEARNELEMVATDVESLPRGRLRLQSEFYDLRATVAWEIGERTSTLPDFEAASEAANAWCEMQPRRNRAHRLRVDRLRQLGRARNWLGDFEGSSEACRESVDAAEKLAALFPEDPTTATFLIDCLCDFAYMLRDRFRQQDLAEAASCIARALQVDERLGDAMLPGRHPRWVLLTTHAAIEESRGGADAGCSWAQVDGALPSSVPPYDAEVDLMLEGLTGIARWRLRTGELGEVQRRIALARTIVETRPGHRERLVEVGWLEANLAVAAGDPAAAAAAAERVAAARPTWFGLRRAADCLRLAWRAAGSGAEADGYRDRAAGLYQQVAEQLGEDVAKAPDDPRFVLPWGFSRVHLAEIAAAAGDAALARGHLTAALPLLEQVREDAQHDQWSEEAFAAGRELQRRLDR